MNKEYIYIDEKAIIKNDDNEMEAIKYYNELDTVLEQENLVETIKNKIRSIEGGKHLIHIPSNFELLIPSLACGLAPVIFVPIAHVLGMFNPVLNNVVTFTTILAVCMGGFGSVLAIPAFIQRKKDKNVLNGMDCELEFLNKTLDKEIEKLEELSIIKTYNHENKNFRVVKINDKKIEKLDKTLKLYYSCGYNGKKYYKLYKKSNTLPKELIETFKDGEIEIIKDFLEEKGPVLTKRKKV